tara:strand:- start:172 stop:561 length:390 start_codon:yes stop_codon:yes gene_type:complete
MYVSALVLSLIYLMGQTDLVLAQIIESDKDYIPGESETSQLITSSFEVRRAVIALIIIAVVALFGLWYYWRRTGQWARARFVDEHGEDLLSKRETVLRKLFKRATRAKSKRLSLSSGSRTGEAAGSADL